MTNHSAIVTLDSAAAAAVSTGVLPTIPSEVSYITAHVARAFATGSTPSAPVSFPTGAILRHMANLAATETATAVSAGAHFLLVERSAAGSSDIDGLGLAVVSNRDRVLNRLINSQGSETVGDDRGLVNEKLVSAIVGSDETVAFGIAEPVNCSGRSRRRLIVLRHTERRRRNS